MDTFTTRLICNNCGKGSTFTFPKGTNLIKAPWGDGTRAIIPGPPGEAVDHKTVTCPKCGSEKIG